MNEAIKRILAQHYGGNVAHPGFQRMVDKLRADPSAQGRNTKLYLQQLQQQGMYRSLG